MITLSYPKLFLLIFGIKEGEVAPDYELIMRIYSLSFLFYSFNKFVQCYYPSVLKNLPSFLNTVLQHGLLGIPLGKGLLYALKDIGYATSVVLIESLSLVTTVVFVLIYSRKKKLESILLIPKYKSSSQKEELIVKSLEGVVEMKKKIKDKALEMGLSELSSDSLSLKTENLISSIFKYGYKGKCRNSGIDLILRKEEDTVILSIKDDGIPLDPTIYQKQEEQSASFSKESFSMTYLRILNLNETIIKINTADDKIDKAVIQ